MANMRKPELLRAASYDGLDLGDGTRGGIIEAVLAEEFEEHSKAIDDFVAEAETGN